ncbi:hypothetical protein, partial [Enterobacter sp. 37]|uniref:hypothetical protein n=1 Tax=Enterobacter sp. 37 TaxID=3085083 RepID=UPI002FC839BC
MDERYTEDFDHNIGSRQGKMRQYLSRLGGFSAKSAENRQSEKKIQKVLVLKNGIPIMRLHRHGGCESLHKQPGRLKRKN